jgi:hypothetical protein
MPCFCVVYTLMWFRISVHIFANFFWKNLSVFEMLRISNFVCCLGKHSENYCAMYDIRGKHTDGKSFRLSFWFPCYEGIY